MFRDGRATVPRHISRRSRNFERSERVVLRGFPRPSVESRVVGGPSGPGHVSRVSEGSRTAPRPPGSHLLPSRRLSSAASAIVRRCSWWSPSLPIRLRERLTRGRGLSPSRSDTSPRRPPPAKGAAITPRKTAVPSTLLPGYSSNQARNRAKVDGGDGAVRDTIGSTGPKSIRAASGPGPPMDAFASLASSRPAHNVAAPRIGAVKEGRHS